MLIENMYVLTVSARQHKFINKWKKHSEETQTLHTGCSKAELKIFALPDPLPRGMGRPKFNELEMVTTFTYKPTLVKIDERNFELSW